MTLVMVWLAGETVVLPPNGASPFDLYRRDALLFIGNIVWLGSHYRRRFPGG